MKNEMIYKTCIGGDQEAFEREVDLKEAMKYCPQSQQALREKRFKAFIEMLKNADPEKLFPPNFEIQIHTPPDDGPRQI